MKSNEDTDGEEIEARALKDLRLRYRGCSSDFARWLGCEAPAQVIGRDDAALLPEPLAESLAAGEQRLLREQIPGVEDPRELGAAAAGADASPRCLLRLPLVSGGHARGVDLLLLEPSEVFAALQRFYFPQMAARAPEMAIWCGDEAVAVDGPEPSGPRARGHFREISRRLPESAGEWLRDEPGASAGARCGQFQVATVQGQAQVSWALLRWRGRPALVVGLSGLEAPLAPPAGGGEARDYRELVADAPHGVLLLEGAHALLANDSAARSLGFDDGDTLLAQADLSTLLPGGLREAIAGEQEGDAGEGGDTGAAAQRHEGAWRTRDGRVIYVLANWRRMAWRGRRCVYLGLHDISHRRRDELSRQRNQQRFQDFAELAADFFWELDKSLRFNFVSHRFENVMQIAPKNVLGLSIRQFYERYFPQPASPPWRRHLQALAEHQPQRDFEYRWTRADGQERVIVHTCQPVFDQQGNFAGYRGVGRDMTQDRALAAQVQYHASHDALTGLVNRREFERLLDEALLDAHNSEQQHVLCYVDLDNFKIVNDSCGHSAGDELLRQLGDLFRECVRQSDVVARLGGDEFGILIYSCNMARAVALAEKIRLSVSQFEFLWENKRFSVGASIGLASIFADSSSVNEVMRAADTACYASKESGRNQVTAASEEAGARRSDADRAIQVGNLLDEGQFRLWRQPILALGEGGEAGDFFEVLLRLVEPDGRLISPAAVMPAVERYGLSAKLDRAVFDRTLAWLCAHRDEIDRLALCTINLNGASLLDRELVEHIGTAIAASGIPAEKLCFELAETATIANLSSARAVIDTLGALGCRFALDDFGSGVSSFTFLRSLPIDFIKIDGSFVSRLHEDPVSAEMVRSINRVSQALGCATVAESVEDERTLDALEQMGVDFAQGYCIGRPVPIDGES